MPKKRSSRARLLAYEESPEGRAQRRIAELTLRSHSRGGLGTAEQSELDGLRQSRPSEPPDPEPT